MKLWRITRKSLNRIADTVAERVSTNLPIFDAEGETELFIDGFRIVVTLGTSNDKDAPNVDAVCTNRHIVNPAGLVKAVEMGYKEGLASLEEDILNSNYFSR